MSAEQQIIAFARQVRAQVAAARKGGADEFDLAIAVPAGYLALAAGAPTLDLDGKTVCVVTVAAGEAMAEQAMAETGVWEAAPEAGARGLYQVLGPGGRSG